MVGKEEGTNPHDAFSLFNFLPVIIENVVSLLQCVRLRGGGEKISFLIDVFHYLMCETSVCELLLWGVVT